MSLTSPEHPKLFSLFANLIGTTALASGWVRFGLSLGSFLLGNYTQDCSLKVPLIIRETISYLNASLASTTLASTVRACFYFMSLGNPAMVHRLRSSSMVPWDGGREVTLAGGI